MLWKEKGYSVPLVLIIVLVLFSVPLFYWVTSNDFNASASRNIRGATTSNNVNERPGFSVNITSTSQTWDLVEYLCRTQEECTTSLTSGRRLGTISGGQTDLHQVIVEHTKEWDGYKYIKLYVRSGWYSAEREFNVISAGKIPGSQIYTLSEGSETYEVLVAPIAEVASTFFESAHFSDN
jgi:hypothetical protein